MQKSALGFATTAFGHGPLSGVHFDIDSETTSAESPVVAEKETLNAENKATIATEGEGVIRHTLALLKARGGKLIKHFSGLESAVDTPSVSQARAILLEMVAEGDESKAIMDELDILNQCEAMLTPAHLPEEREVLAYITDIKANPRDAGSPFTLIFIKGANGESFKPLAVGENLMKRLNNLTIGELYNFQLERRKKDSYYIGKDAQTNTWFVAQHGGDGSQWSFRGCQPATQSEKDAVRARTTALVNAEVREKYKAENFKLLEKAVEKHAENPDLVSIMANFLK